MEPQGFAFSFDITSDSLVLNVDVSSKSPSNCNPYSKTSPRSKSSSLALSSNRRSIGDQPCPRGLGSFNGVRFWKSLQRNVKKHMDVSWWFVTPQNPGVRLPTCQCTEYLGIANNDTTISYPIHRDPFMPIYFRKIFKFIKTIHKSSSYNSLILHVKFSFFFFFTKRFLKATVRLSSHLRSRMRVNHIYITCT